jgi:UDP-glucose 4-epimerase
MTDRFILIVGGAGYIGSHVNKLLCQKGYKTVVFDNLSRGHAAFAKWGEFFCGDLSDNDQIRACFNKYSINAVMHFSAFAYVGESVAEPIKYYQNNVANTLNLLEVMIESKVMHFIFSSTCSTYGIPERTPINEEHPQNPINPYGRTKLMVEEVLKDFERAYGMKYASLRYFNAAGADPDAEIGEWHDPETHLIPLLLDAALGRSGPVRVFGLDYNTPDGTCIRDYIHVNDLAVAHILALEALVSGKGSDIFNLGIGRGYSVKDVIESVRRVTGRDIRWEAGPRRSGDPAELVADASKAAKQLGWRPAFVDLDSIVESSWRWHKYHFGGS